jgi:type I restriction enzyme S subunit
MADGAWADVSLGELGDFRNGANFSKRDYGPGLPIINVKQLYRGRYADTRHLLEVEPSAISRPELLQVQRGDVLFARSSVKASGAGQTAMVGACPSNAIFSGFIIRFRVTATDRVIPEFLNYMLRSPLFRELLTRIASGTTISNLSQKTLSGLPIVLPSLDEQRAIAHILGTLDDKIELNRRMNETLEEMARSIFKSWFVDFDPVRAKAEGRQPEGMSKEIAELFPDSFEESELGEIPAGWEAVPIGGFIKHVIGGDWGDETPSAKCTQSVAIIRGTDFARVRSGALDSIPRRFVQPSKFPQRRLEPGDVILEISGGTKKQPTGRSLLVTRGVLDVLGGDVVPASFCKLLRPLRREAAYVLAAHLSELYERGGTWKYQNQSTGISNFQYKYFAATEHLPMPADGNLVTEYATMVGPLYDKIDVGRAECETLADLRDTLLPKLLSGEIRVPEAEQLAGEAA